MGFGSLIHRSTTGEVRKQDQVRVEDYLEEGSKLIMNEDGTCDIEGTVDVSRLDLYSLKQLTPRVKNVSKGFWCSDNNLTSLEGAPITVGGVFICSGNKLTSLESCPKNIEGTFYCDGNQLTSLKGCPESVSGDFYCDKSFTKSDVLKHCDVGGQVITIVRAKIN